MPLKKSGKKRKVRKTGSKALTTQSTEHLLDATKKTWFHWTLPTCRGMISFPSYGFIYRVTRKVDGKDYIGYKSWHTKPEKYFTSSKYVQEDIDKLGVEAFEFEILFTCKGKAELRGSEIELQIQEDVLSNPNNYNRHIGHLMWFNDRCSEETKAKLRKAGKGRIVSTETRIKLSKAGTGKVRSDESKEASSKAMKGKKHSTKPCPWCCRDISISLYDRFHGDNCASDVKKRND